MKAQKPPILTKVTIGGIPDIVGVSALGSARADVRATTVAAAGVGRASVVGVSNGHWDIRNFAVLGGLVECVFPGLWDLVDIVVPVRWVALSPFCKELNKNHAISTEMYMGAQKTR